MAKVCDDVLNLAKDVLYFGTFITCTVVYIELSAKTNFELTLLFNNFCHKT